jgi:signal transduction histidine kinase
MSRYKLTEDKQKQIAGMINSESRRLAKMIQTFLDVERLAEGEIELKRDPFLLNEVLLIALDRARTLAERKEMTLNVGAIPAGRVFGDHAAGLVNQNQHFAIQETFGQAQAVAVGELAVTAAIPSSDTRPGPRTSRVLGPFKPCSGATRRRGPLPRSRTSARLVRC